MIILFEKKVRIVESGFCKITSDSFTHQRFLSTGIPYNGNLNFLNTLQQRTNLSSKIKAFGKNTELLKFGSPKNRTDLPVLSTGRSKVLKASIMGVAHRMDRQSRVFLCLRSPICRPEGEAAPRRAWAMARPSATFGSNLRSIGNLKILDTAHKASYDQRLLPNDPCRRWAPSIRYPIFDSIYTLRYAHRIAATGFDHIDGLCKVKALSGDGDKSPFFNFTFDKGRLKNLVSWTLENYGQYKTVELLEQLKKTGFEYATKAGISLGIDDLKIPPKKKILLLEAEQLTKLTVHQYQRADITAVERFQRLIDTWHRTSEQLKQEVINYFEETDILNPVYMMAFSGARGNISQVRQLVGMRGLMSDPQGQIIDFPIRSNFREGLTLTEYIISSYGARKGIVDTALRTANAGYLTRRLVDVAQHVIISHFDCGTRKGIFLTDMKEGNKTIVSAQSRIIGRVLARDIYKSNSKIKVFSRNQEISTDLAFEITKITNKIFVRSSLTCNTNKLICQLCYGWSLAQGNLVSVGEAVGVIAAQSIGEPGTQLTMRTFHTGGVFSGDVSDEIRAPYNGFVHYANTIPGILIRTLDGKILFLTKSDGMLIFSKNSKRDFSVLTDIKKYKIPAYTVLFLRNGESTIQKQVVAQITTISTKPNMRDTAELVIKSELEGFFYAKNLQIQKNIIGPKPKFVGESKQDILLDPKAMEIVVKARGWNFAWVLSGKRYEMPLLLKSFPIIGDYLTKQTVIATHNLKPPTLYSLGLSVTSSQKKDILLIKHQQSHSLMDSSVSSTLRFVTNYTDLPVLSTGRSKDLVRTELRLKAGDQISDGQSPLSKYSPLKNVKKVLLFNLFTKSNRLYRRFQRKLIRKPVKSKIAAAPEGPNSVLAVAVPKVAPATFGSNLRYFGSRSSTSWSRSMLFDKRQPSKGTSLSLKQNKLFSIPKASSELSALRQNLKIGKTGLVTKIFRRLRPESTLITNYKSSLKNIHSRRECITSSGHTPKVYTSSRSINTNSPRVKFKQDLLFLNLEKIKYHKIGYLNFFNSQTSLNMFRTDDVYNGMDLSVLRKNKSNVLKFNYNFRSCHILLSPTSLLKSASSLNTAVEDLLLLPTGATSGTGSSSTESGPSQVMTNLRSSKPFKRLKSSSFLLEWYNLNPGRSPHMSLESLNGYRTSRTSVPVLSGNPDIYTSSRFKPIVAHSRRDTQNPLQIYPGFFSKAPFIQTLQSLIRPSARANRQTDLVFQEKLVSGEASKYSLGLVTDGLLYPGGVIAAEGRYFVPSKIAPLEGISKIPSVTNKMATAVGDKSQEGWDGKIHLEELFLQHKTQKRLKKYKKNYLQYKPYNASKIVSAVPTQTERLRKYTKDKSILFISTETLKQDGQKKIKNLFFNTSKVGISRSSKIFCNGLGEALLRMQYINSINSRQRILPTTAKKLSNDDFQFKTQNFINNMFLQPKKQKTHISHRKNFQPHPLQKAKYMDELSALPNRTVRYLVPYGPKANKGLWDEQSNISKQKKLYHKQQTSIQTLIFKTWFKNSLFKNARNGFERKLGIKDLSVLYKNRSNSLKGTTPAITICNKKCSIKNFFVSPLLSRDCIMAKIDNAITKNTVIMSSLRQSDDLSCRSFVKDGFAIPKDKVSYNGLDHINGLIAPSGMGEVHPRTSSIIFKPLASIDVRQSIRKKLPIFEYVKLSPKHPGTKEIFKHFKKQAYKRYTYTYGQKNSKHVEDRSFSTQALNIIMGKPIRRMVAGYTLSVCPEEATSHQIVSNSVSFNNLDKCTLTKATETKKYITNTNKNKILSLNNILKRIIYSLRQKDLSVVSKNKPNKNKTILKNFSLFNKKYLLTNNHLHYICNYYNNMSVTKSILGNLRYINTFFISYNYVSPYVSYPYKVTKTKYQNKTTHPSESAALRLNLADNNDVFQPLTVFVKPVWGLKTDEGVRDSYLRSSNQLRNYMHKRKSLEKPIVFIHDGHSPYYHTLGVCPDEVMSTSKKSGISHNMPGGLNTSSIVTDQVKYVTKVKKHTSIWVYKTLRLSKLPDRAGMTSGSSNFSQDLEVYPPEGGPEDVSRASALAIDVDYKKKLTVTPGHYILDNLLFNTNIIDIYIINLLALYSASVPTVQMDTEPMRQKVGESRKSITDFSEIKDLNSIFKTEFLKQNLKWIKNKKPRFLPTDLEFVKSNHLNRIVSAAVDKQSPSIRQNSILPKDRRLLPTGAGVMMHHSESAKDNCNTIALLSEDRRLLPKVAGAPRRGPFGDGLCPLLPPGADHPEGPNSVLLLPVPKVAPEGSSSRSKQSSLGTLKMEISKHQLTVENFNIIPSLMGILFKKELKQSKNMLFFDKQAQPSTHYIFFTKVHEMKYRNNSNDIYTLGVCPENICVKDVRSATGLSTCTNLVKSIFFNKNFLQISKRRKTKFCPTYGDFSTYIISWNRPIYLSVKPNNIFSKRTFHSLKFIGHVSKQKKDFKLLPKMPNITLSLTNNVPALYGSNLRSFGLFTKIPGLETSMANKNRRSPLRTLDVVTDEQLTKPIVMDKVRYEPAVSNTNFNTINKSKRGLLPASVLISSVLTKNIIVRGVLKNKTALARRLPANYISGLVLASKNQNSLVYKNLFKKIISYIKPQFFDSYFKYPSYSFTYTAKTPKFAENFNKKLLIIPKQPCLNICFYSKNTPFLNSKHPLGIIHQQNKRVLAPNVRIKKLFKTRHTNFFNKLQLISSFVARGNHCSPFEGELLYTRPYKTYLDLNPYQNIKTGLISLNNPVVPFGLTDEINSDLLKYKSDKVTKKTKKEKTRIAMFKYYLKNLNTQKIGDLLGPGHTGWSRVNLILTKNDLITLNYNQKTEKQLSVFSEISFDTNFLDGRGPSSIALNVIRQAADASAPPVWASTAALSVSNLRGILDRKSATLRPSMPSAYSGEWDEVPCSAPSGSRATFGSKGQSSSPTIAKYPYSEYKHPDFVYPITFTPQFTNSQICMNYLFEKYMKNTIKSQTLWQLNKENHFNKAYNFNIKNMWLQHNLICNRSAYSDIGEVLLIPTGWALPIATEGPNSVPKVAPGGSSSRSSSRAKYPSREMTSGSSNLRIGRQNPFLTSITAHKSIKTMSVYKIKIYVLYSSLRNILTNNSPKGPNSVLAVAVPKVALLPSVVIIPFGDGLCPLLPPGADHPEGPNSVLLLPVPKVATEGSRSRNLDVDSVTYLQDPSQKLFVATEIKAKHFLLSPYNSRLNIKWVHFKQKKIVTKNKVGFFFLKGNTFFNTSTKFTNKLLNHHHKRNTPSLTFVFNSKIYNLDYCNGQSPLRTTIIQDTRHLDLILSLELQKMHLNNYFLSLKPLSDKLRFSQSSKTLVHYTSRTDLPVLSTGRSKAHHKRWNFIKSKSYIQPSPVWMHPQGSSTSSGPPSGGTPRVYTSRSNEHLFLNFLKPINAKSSRYVQKEIFVCASLNNSNDISLQTLRFLYINVLKDFITNNLLGNQASDGQSYQDANRIICDSHLDGSTNTPFEVIKKSGQLIHMNKHKITLRLGQPLVISPRSIIHATHGDFISSKTAVITLTYQQLKTGDIVQGIPKIEQLFEARTTKRGRLFRDNVTNLLTGLFLKYFVKSTYLLRKNIIPISDGYLRSHPSDMVLRKNRLALEINQKTPFNLKFALEADNQNALATNSQLVNNKQNQTIILALALQWSVKQSFYKIQQIIVDGILRVYRSQGVSIADKHVEIIVKQMTSKVKIINSNASKMNDYTFSLQNINRSLDTEVHNNDTKRPVLLRSNNTDSNRYKQKDSTKAKPKRRKIKRDKLPKKASVTFENKLLERLVANNLEGPTGLFPGEIVDIDFVENINTFLLKTASLEGLNSYSQMSFAIEPIKYEPIVLGITRASLEVESFLSAASFQQTTRVLSQAALYKKKDFLKGLKENIIIGNLIPAGTGYLSSINV